MWPEPGALSRPLRAPTTRPTATRATRQAVQAGPICLMPRQLDPPIAAALDALPAADLPRFDVTDAATRVRAGVTAAMPPVGRQRVFDWLRDDILGLIDLYVSATGCRRVRARLQVVADDMCRSFHVDNVAFRLVTTYRGPGTQWIAPGRLQHAPEGEPFGPEAVRQMPRGTVAILRGGKDAMPGCPGLLHRSPPIAGTGVVRLFFAVDEAGC